jgi:hypothetical protein
MNMKGPLSLLIALMLLTVPVFSMAEAASDVTYAAYTNAAKGYAIDYPESWTLVSKETLESVLGSMANGETKSESMNSSALKTYAFQIKDMDMVMFLSPDGAVYAIVTDQAATMQVTSQEILTQVCPLVKKQYESIFTDYKELADPAVQTVGGREFVKTFGQYSLSGQRYIMLEAYLSTDSALYAVTYTIDTGLNPDMDAINAITDAMMASLQSV